jgi:hypothetical protein
MSFVGANDHPEPVSPQDPLYYAPRSVRGSTAPRSSAGQPADSDDYSSNLPVSRFDEMREEAFAKFARPLEAQFVDDRRRSRGLLATVGAVAVAVCAVAMLALVVMNMFSGSKSDPSELAVSISTPALATQTPVEPAPSEESRALLEGFKQFQKTQGAEAPTAAGQATTAREAPEKSQALLEKFMQWQERK